MAMLNKGQEEDQKKMREAARKTRMKSMRDPFSPPKSIAQRRAAERTPAPTSQPVPQTPSVTVNVGSGKSSGPSAPPKTGNAIVDGMMMGATYGKGNPYAIAGGAALGAIQNLAKREARKKKLKAEAIYGQSEAFSKASQQEQQALKGIMDSLRQSLIF